MRVLDLISEQVNRRINYTLRDLIIDGLRCPFFFAVINPKVNSVAVPFVVFVVGITGGWRAVMKASVKVKLLFDIIKIIIKIF